MFLLFFMWFNWQNIYYVFTTLQAENFHWNFNFAISLMENSVSLNFANDDIFKNLSMIAYVIENQNSPISFTVNLTKPGHLMKFLVYFHPVRFLSYF